MKRCAQCGTQMDPSAGICRECGSKVHLQEGEPLPRALQSERFRRWIVRAMMTGVVLGGVLIFANQLLRTYNPIIAEQPTVAMTAVASDERINSVSVKAHMEGGFITISLNEVKEHLLVCFFDPDGKQEIPLIAYITPTGKLVTAMSISEHCGSRDFYLQGNDIHCSNCPSYWNMASLEAYACCARYYPDPLPSSLVGDRIRIDARIVRQWQSRL
jgi:hypothetical protein